MEAVVQVSIKDEKAVENFPKPGENLANIENLASINAKTAPMRQKQRLCVGLDCGGCHWWLQTQEVPKWLII